MTQFDVYACYDGNFRYVCEKEHNSFTREPFLDRCPAVLPWYGQDDPRNGPPCGADIKYRLVDYRPPQ